MLEVMTMTSESKDDGMREFSVAKADIGEEVFAMSDRKVRYEYAGQGKAVPVKDSKSERKSKTCTRIQRAGNVRL